MEPNCDFLVRLQTLIQAGELDSALETLTAENNRDAVRENTWDLAEMLSKFLAKENDLDHVDDEATITICAKMLRYLPEVGNVKELLLVLLEQTECFEDDTKYEILLNPIQQCLLKLDSKRAHSVAISVETLYGHLAALPLPQEYYLEGKEKITLDLDEDVQRISHLTKAFVGFLDPLVMGVSWIKTPDQHQENVKTVEILVSCLMKLLDHPLVYVDVTLDMVDDGEKLPPKSTRRVCVEQIMTMLSHLCKDFHKAILQFLDMNDQIEHKNKKTKDFVKKSGEEFRDLDSYNVDDTIPLLGISHFWYLAHGEELGLDNFPQIFTKQHILQFSCPFITCLLQRPESIVVNKGLVLLASVLCSMAELTLPRQLLEWTDVKELLKAFVSSMTTSRVKSLGQLAVKLLKEFIMKFDLAGRSKLLYFLLKETTHPGLASYLITLMKDEIDKNLKSATVSEHFTGTDLKGLLDLVLALPQCEQTDLLEQSERIMGALNLLRYLVIRDKPGDNVTGIWDIVPTIEDTYCNMLRKGINLSRAHYNLELKKAKSGKLEKAPDVSFSVGDQDMPEMTPQEHARVMEMAIHTFDMMESVLGRVTEIISQQAKTRTVCQPCG